MESRVRTGAAAASPRPVERRTRRLSAPSSFFDQRAAAEPKREVAGSPSQARQWVTTSSTAWRTAPSSMGYRIDLLPRGWQVTQASWAEHPVEGWLPIVPKGFVQLSDLVEAGEDSRAGHRQMGCPKHAEWFATRPTSSPLEEDPTMVTPPPASRGSPGLSPPQLAAEKPASQHDGARAALLALREEHVRLREANLKLRERELNKRQEIDSLTVARDLTAKELAAVQEDLEESKQELEQSQELQSVLVRKLELCREAISTAVKSVDALYAVPTKEQTDPASPRRSAQVRQLQANALGADEAITELIAAMGTPQKGSPSKAKECAEEGKTIGWEDDYTHALENAHARVKEPQKVSPKPKDRAPLRALNA
ncbi:unnamed protein product [Effrenium voratum]|nr:unnamed protein product [Effrenium voratum]